MFIHAIGHFHPEGVIDNEFLESLDIDTDNEWIVSRTGIQRRHSVLPLDYIKLTRNRDPRAADEASIYSNAETACRATQHALARAEIGSEEIGLVIAGGSSPRISSPAEACVIAEKLGTKAPAFDLNSACTTWAVQMRALSMMNPNSMPDFVLAINPENLTRTVDYSDRRNAVLMGDCTTASIVSHRVPSAIRVESAVMQTDPEGWSKVTIAPAGYLQQDGGAVQNFAIRKTVALLDELRPSAGEEFWFIGHQANLPMLRSASARAGIPEAKHLHNVEFRGNCGAAGAPSTLSENLHRFQPGDRAVVALVGAGLTWAGLVLAFEGVSAL